MSDLRKMIRELLLEELGKIKENTSSGETNNPPSAHEVTISNSADLSRFATNVLSLAKDSNIANQIERGDYPFRLLTTAGVSMSSMRTVPSNSQSGATPKYFEKGIVTEKDIAALPAEVNEISCGTSVCLTPLARDALRRREIKIVRKSS